MIEDIITIIKKGNTYVSIQDRIMMLLRRHGELSRVEIFTRMNENTNLPLSAISWALALLNRGLKIRLVDDLWEAR